MSNESTFCRPDVIPEDREALLNGFPPGHPFHDPENYDDPLPFETLADHETLAHVMCRAGLFQSVSQARKNGWDRPVEPGFRIYVVGKKRHSVIVLAPWEG
jgi:hypothetical protein